MQGGHAENVRESMPTQAWAWHLGEMIRSLGA